MFAVLMYNSDTKEWVNVGTFVFYAGALLCRSSYCRMGYRSRIEWSD